MRKCEICVKITTDGLRLVECKTLRLSRLSSIDPMRKPFDICRFIKRKTSQFALKILKIVVIR